MMEYNNMVRLEIPLEEHKEQHLAMLKEFIDNGEEIIPNAMEVKEDEHYDDFLRRVQNYRDGINIKPGYCRASLFFISDDDGKLVGGIHIRHELVGTLSIHGGHIGYGIRPSERNQGYAGEALQMALEECKELGINPVMLTCRTDNTASAKTIMKNGGKLECEYNRDGKPHQKRRIEIVA